MSLMVKLGVQYPVGPEPTMDILESDISILNSSAEESPQDKDCMCSDVTECISKTVSDVMSCASPDETRTATDFTSDSANHRLSNSMGNTVRDQHAPVSDDGYVTNSRYGTSEHGYPNFELSSIWITSQVEQMWHISGTHVGYPRHSTPTKCDHHSMLSSSPWHSLNHPNHHPAHTKTVIRRARCKPNGDEIINDSMKSTQSTVSGVPVIYRRSSSSETTLNSLDACSYIPLVGSFTSDTSSTNIIEDYVNDIDHDVDFAKKYPEELSLHDQRLSLPSPEGQSDESLPVRPPCVGQECSPIVPTRTLQQRSPPSCVHLQRSVSSPNLAAEFTVARGCHQSNDAAKSTVTRGCHKSNETLNCGSEDGIVVASTRFTVDSDATHFMHIPLYNEEVTCDNHRHRNVSKKLRKVVKKMHKFGTKRLGFETIAVI